MKDIISEQCRDPDELKRTAFAFDQTWSVIAEVFANDPTLAEAMRLRLARIILNSPASDLLDLSQIRSASLQILALSCPAHAETIRQLMSSKADAEEGLHSSDPSVIKRYRRYR